MVQVVVGVAEGVLWHRLRRQAAAVVVLPADRADDRSGESVAVDHPVRLIEADFLPAVVVDRCPNLRRQQASASAPPNVLLIVKEPPLRSTGSNACEGDITSINL